jgi:hypothetical protein
MAFSEEKYTFNLLLKKKGGNAFIIIFLHVVARCFFRKIWKLDTKNIPDLNQAASSVI